MKLSDPIALVLNSKDKNRVLSIAPDQSVYEAIEKMAEHGIGALLVISNKDWWVFCRSVTTPAK